MTHDRIDRRSEDIRLLKNRIVDLEALSGLQQNALQSYQSTIAGLEETVLKLAASVTVLEKSVCRCRDHLLSPGPHYASGEEVVEETEKEEESKEEEGLEYATDTPSGGSYTTPPSTGGHSSPSSAPSRSPTPGDSDPENNAALRTEELEARIEAFLEEAEEDLLMDNLPPAENTSPILVLAPIFLGIIPFAVSTSQRCVPPKHLVRKVYHPYKDPVGQCRCEPGGWCDNLPCSGRKRRVSHKIRGRGSSNGSSRSGRSCCGSSEEPVNHLPLSHLLLVSQGFSSGPPMNPNQDYFWINLSLTTGTTTPIRYVPCVPTLYLFHTIGTELYPIFDRIPLSAAMWIPI